MSLIDEYNSGIYKNKRTIEQLEKLLDYIETMGDDKWPFPRFGVDDDGNHGYYKDGADTVTPFKNGTGEAEVIYKFVDSMCSPYRFHYAKNSGDINNNFQNIVNNNLHSLELDIQPFNTYVFTDTIQEITEE